MSIQDNLSMRTLAHKRNFIAFLIGLLPSLSFGSTVIKIEAENAILSGDHTIENNENASNSTFIKLNNSSSSDGIITFTIDEVPIDGTYKLEVFHFNGDVNQSVDVSINGGASSTKTLQKSNWAYQDRARSTLWSVNLLSGTNTITLEAAHTTILIDKIKLTDNFNVYYIASNGDDSNSGTYWNPWKTLSKVNEAFETDGNGGSLNAGDRILFRSGDTFLGELKVKRSGSKDNPISIASYGPGELPILSGSGNITGGDYLSALNLVNASHIDISYLWIKNDRQNDTRYGWNEKKGYGIYCQANKWGGVSEGLTFHNLNITDVYSVGLPEDFDAIKVTGLRFESDANEEDGNGNITKVVRFADVQVYDCYFSHVGKAGIWATHSGDFTDSDWTINRNMNFVIMNNTFYQTGGSGVILGKMYNALVERNDFNQTGYSNGTETRLAGRGSGLWTFRCKHVIAQYNNSYNVKGNGDSYGMHIDFGNEDVIFQYNYSENSEGGFCEILGSNNRCTYRFNVSVNDGYRDNHGNSIWVSGFAGSGNTPIRSDSNYIYNNTIYLTENYTPNIEIYAGNTYVYNNAFMTTGSGSIASEGEVIDIANGSLRVSHNYFRGNISTTFQNRDNNKVTEGWPNFHNASSSSNTGFQIYESSAFVDAGRSFSQPAFPMAGQGIFINIPEYPEVDAFGNSVDIENQAPNIGADNNHSSNIFCTAVTGTDSRTACDSYTWIDGVTYTESNNSATYTFPGGASSGCDSVVTLDLTISNSPTGVTASITDETCQQSDGTITFSFPDSPSRTGIEFSTDGGLSYPTNVNDNIGNTSVTNLSSGDYQLFVRWGNNQCPIDLGSVTIDETNCNYDCNGDINGTATIDACGVCSAGLTGVTPSSPTNWYADIDNDGLGDPNSSVEDCNQPSGYVANANDDCPSDPNNTCNAPIDCNGDINGNATLDDCGICSGGLTGVESCTQDCNGDWGGSAEIDQCQVCSGGNTNIEVDECAITGLGNTTKTNSVYPNPTTDFVHLTHKTTWTVTNIQGEVLDTGDGDIIDLNTVASGVYIITTPTNSYKVIKK